MICMLQLHRSAKVWQNDATIKLAIFPIDEGGKEALEKTCDIW